MKLRVQTEKDMKVAELGGPSGSTGPATEDEAKQTGVYEPVVATDATTHRARIDAIDAFIADVFDQENVRADFNAKTTAAQEAMRKWRRAQAKQIESARLVNDMYGETIIRVPEETHANVSRDGTRDESVGPT